MITGAAGRIGSFLALHIADRYDLVLADLRPSQEPHLATLVQADITAFESVRSLCPGVDTIIHLAADPSTHASWESLLPRNIIGVYHILEAAAQAGCRRVIFASSVNAVSGYPQDIQVHTHMPVRPANLYGATKAWGEAIARYYADQRGLSAICLRFGWVQRRDSELLRPDGPLLDLLLTYEDLARLVVASIEAPDSLRFGIYHGLSNNRWNRLDISESRTELGYAPEDDAFVLAGVFPPR